MGTQGNVLVGLGSGFITLGAYGTVEGSSDDLGYTEGGAELSLVREYYKKFVDQELGPISMTKTSENSTLKFTLVETTLENLAIALDYPTGAISSSVLSVGGDDTVTYRTIYLNVVGPTGGTRKYTFHKCVNISAATHSYKKDDKTMIECEFQLIQDTTKTTNQQLFTVTDSASDTTAPTIAMTTPADDGTVTKDTQGTVVLTITETNAMDESSIVYGAEDGATIMILNDTTRASTTLVAATIVYDSSAKTVTITPDSNWSASDTLQVVVTTGLRDANGNHLATTFIGQFSVTA